MPSRQVIAVLAAGLLTVVVLTAVTVLRLRSSPAASAKHVCDELEIAAGLPSRKGTPPDASTPAPEPGWELLAPAPVVAEVVWRFSLDSTPTHLRERLDGLYQAGRAIDLVRTDLSVDQGSEGHRTRQVVVPPGAWVEDAAADERHTCLPLSAFQPLQTFDGASVELDWRKSEEPHNRMGIFVGHDPVMVQRTGEGQQEGDHVTTYRVKPEPGYEHIEITIAVDDQRHLRAIDARDTREDVVITRYRNDPLPGHPPIGDPTGQPVIDAGN